MHRQRLGPVDSGLEHKDWQKLKRLTTPAKVQDFVNSLPFNFADGYSIDRSVKGILKKGKADCAGGAVLAATLLWMQGRKPMLLDIKAPHPRDYDHVVAIFKEGKYWGAISKTNHSVLRYREPVYRSVRELAMSYFHEYFLPSGEKTMRSFSKPFDLSRFGTSWLTSKDAVIDIIHELDNSPHTDILTKTQEKRLRKADYIERMAGDIKEWKGR